MMICIYLIVGLCQYRVFYMDIMFLTEHVGYEVPVYNDLEVSQSIKMLNKLLISRLF